MAIRLKDLVAGQQRLQQQEEAPVRLNPDQFKGLVEALSGAATSAGAKSGAQIFEEFVAQTRKREELLKDATDEQKAIFSELEGTLKKLQSANHADSVGLRKSIDGLNRRLAATPNTAAKSRMVSMMPPPPSASTKNTFAPTLTPENYAINENATTTGTAEVKKSEGGGLGAAISGIGTAIGGLAEGLGRAIQGIGSVIGSAIGALTTAITGKGIVDALRPDGGPDDLIVGGDSDSKKTKRKGPKAERYRDPKTGQYAKRPMKLPKGVKLGLAGMATGFIGNTAADMLDRSGHETAGAAVGIGTDVLGYAATGALIGSAVPFIGTGFGAAAGAAYGLYEGLTTRTNINDPNRKKGLVSTQFMNPQDNAMAELERQNQILKENANGNTIINNITNSGSTNATPSVGPVFAPGPSIRPTESAYDKYQMRIFSL